MCIVPEKLPSPGPTNSSESPRRRHINEWFYTFSNWKLRRIARVQVQVRSYLMACVEIMLLSKLADLEWRVWIFHLEFPFITLTIPLYLLFSKITPKYYQLGISFACDFSSKWVVLFSGTSFTNELLYLGWSNGDPECRRAVKITVRNPNTTFVLEWTECSLKCIPTFSLLLYPPLPSSAPIFTINCMYLFSTVTPHLHLNTLGAVF